MHARKLKIIEIYEHSVCGCENLLILGGVICKFWQRGCQAGQLCAVFGAGHPVRFKSNRQAGSRNIQSSMVRLFQIGCVGVARDVRTTGQKSITSDDQQVQSVY
jgi:hypothetical protein